MKNIFGFILMLVVGIGFIYLSSKDIVLDLIGETTNIISYEERRLGGASEAEGSDRSYKWTVSYDFKVAGEKFFGTHDVRGSSHSANLEKTEVYYLKLNPNINSLTSNETNTSLVHLFIGIFCLYISKLCFKDIKRR